MTSLAVQWLGLHASTAGDKGSIPGWGIKIPHAVVCEAKKKKEKEWHVKKEIKTRIAELLANYDKEAP